MSPDDALARLSRSDKWYLASGRGALFAPTFPRYLDRPGFWDEVFHADIRIDRLFSMLLVGDDGRPISLRANRAPGWRPECLNDVLFDPEQCLTVGQERTVTARNTFASRLRIRNAASDVPARFHLLMWSLQQKESFVEGQRMASVTKPEVRDDCLVFAHRVQGEKGVGDVWVALGASLPRASYTVNLAEMTATEPQWEVSVFPEKFRKRTALTPPSFSLPNEFHAEADWRGSIFGPSLLHLAQHYVLDLEPGGEATVTFAAAVAFDKDEAIANLKADLAGDVVAESAADWKRYFASTPTFASGDAHLDTYLPYRYYGLRLSTIDLKDNEPFAFPCVMEGIGMFRSLISYSAQVHAREARWLRDGGRLAEGCLLGLLHVQEPNGFLPGHTYTWRDSRAFYHADWGDVALAVHAVTGRDAFLESVYPGLVRYARYFEQERDPEGWHLYDIIDQNETGQEYMSRYLFADPDADDWRAIRLKGVDATVYVYRLQRALAQMERLLGKGNGAGWDAEADATRAAVRARMWDPEAEMFCDVDPRTGARSPYLAVVGFYPFLTDVAGPEHLPALRRHLLNPEEFWTEFPVPASPLTDPYFDAGGQWKGKRTNCPWNGRTWPMTNSHVADALAYVARTLDPSFAPIAAEFIERYVKMMFFDGDPARPNCFEHYNPLTGTPCLYRGVDDYMHSWVADLYVRHLCGVLPQNDGTLVIDPLWRRAEPWTLANLPWRGRTLEVRWRPDGDGLTVWVDGEERARRSDIGRLEVAG